MRKATQFLLMAVVFFGLVTWSTAQTQQKKQSSATQDSTEAGSQSDEAAQTSGGTDTGGSSATTKKKKGTSSGSGSSGRPSESGVAPAPKGRGNSGGQEIPKESVEYKDPEDQTTRGKAKPAPSAQANPMYKDNANQGTMCGTTDHQRACKPGEKPTATGTTSTTESSADSTKKPK